MENSVLRDLIQFEKDQEQLLISKKEKFSGILDKEFKKLISEFESEINEAISKEPQIIQDSKIKGNNDAQIKAKLYTKEIQKLSEIDINKGIHIIFEEFLKNV